LTIAGAGIGRGVAEQLEKARHELGKALDCRGQVSESEKQHLFASFDYFLFPSLYPHETQSSAVPEALVSGAWVIAYDHRFVGEFLRAGGGTLIPVVEEFGSAAASWIAQHSSHESRVANKFAAREQGALIRTQAAHQLEQLLNWLDGSH
jgi:glycosyltransferase involved in cell wall biosynthesis